MKPLNPIARLAKVKADRVTQEYYDQLVSMLARRQGIDESSDTVMTEMDANTLRKEMARLRDEWVKKTILLLTSDVKSSVETVKEKAVFAAEQVAKQVMKDMN